MTSLYAQAALFSSRVARFTLGNKQCPPITRGVGVKVTRTSRLSTLCTFLRKLQDVVWTICDVRFELQFDGNANDKTNDKLRKLTVMSYQFYRLHTYMYTFVPRQKSPFNIVDWFTSPIINCQRFALGICNLCSVTNKLLPKHRFVFAQKEAPNFVATLDQILRITMHRMLQIL